MRRLGCQLDLAAPGPAGHGGHLGGPAHQRHRLLGPHVDRGGEADGAAGHHAHAHAEFGGVRRRLGQRVVQAQRLRADALDAQLGRLAPRPGGGVEGGVGQGGQFVRGQWHQGTLGWRTGRPAAR